MKLRVTADGSTLLVLPDGQTEPYEHDRTADDPVVAPGNAVRLVQQGRERLGLTQAGFAVRLRLPAGTLRDWEQGRRMPDAAAITLLRLVAGAPQVLQRLTTRFADAQSAARYLEKFATAAGTAQLRTEIALVLRHSPFGARALLDAAKNAPGKLRRVLEELPTQ